MRLWIRLKLSLSHVFCNNINSTQRFFPARNDLWLIFTLISPFQMWSSVDSRPLCCCRPKRKNQRKTWTCSAQPDGSLPAFFLCLEPAHWDGIMTEGGKRILQEETWFVKVQFWASDAAAPRFSSTQRDHVCLQHLTGALPKALIYINLPCLRLNNPNLAACRNC